MHGTERTKAIDLAARPALHIGPVTIDPASRQFNGPEGCASVGPQIMLVFLALFEAGGRVVSRDDLVEQAWSGRFVAEDSLNGAISEIRRALRSAGATDIEIVTVPKTGYRLQYPSLSEANTRAADSAPHATTDSLSSASASRRLVLGSGAALLMSGAGIWLWQRGSDSRRVDHLIDRGLIALRQGLPEYDAQGVEAFRAATELDPDNARAWGLLALSLKAAAEYGPPGPRRQRFIDIDHEYHDPVIDGGIC